MRMYDLILKKRNGNELSNEEIAYIVTNYTNNTIPDYQMSAFLMAVYFNGMNEKETVALTTEMANSGDMLDLSMFGDLTVDKHSTGGVGDKTTLIVAPILAALGAKVAKMSGRGLGHTGGTIDKLEAIQGFTTSLSKADFLAQVEKIGIAVIGQSENIATADKKIYALRDVTATVDNVSLISSSIMSKKLAAGSKNIVLDVKVGSGAFMKTPEDAEKLAKSMVDIGRGCGKNICAILTNMDVPLGMCIGNSLEVEEAIEILDGHGDKELTEICIALATKMAELALGYTHDKAYEKICDAINTKAALAKFYEWIVAQGTDKSLVESNQFLVSATSSFDVIAPCTAYISYMDAEKIGRCACIAGAGRESKADAIDLSAGIKLYAKTGCKVSAGEKIATVYTKKLDLQESITKAFLEALEFSAQKPLKQKLILKIV